ncbi:MAG: ATP-binding protein [Candidatus Hydrogenedentota bacterium]
MLVATTCLSLGIVVLVRNPRKLTHQAFALLTFNLTLWAIGVFGVVQSTSVESATIWIHFAEVASCFIPATLYHFVGYFPKGKFDGSTRLLSVLYGLAIVLSLNSLTPNYIYNVELVEGGLPKAQHHGSILFFLITAVSSILAVHRNLRRKYKDAQGFERRQIQFVVTGCYTVAFTAVLLILLEQLFKIQSMQAYGPTGILLLIVPFAYAMVRYHLLDTRAFLSRLGVYIGSISFVVLTIIAINNLVDILLPDNPENAFVVSAVLSAIIISLIFQTVYTAAEYFIEVTLLRQRYDIDKLYRRIAEQAGESSDLEKLLSSISKDIEETIGVDVVRVLLLDQDDPDLLTTEFTTVSNEEPIRTREHRVLLEYFAQQPRPLILEKILHRRLDERMIVVARHLADLDAYFCMPLHTNKGLIGILTMGQKRTHDVYSEEELLAFRALSGPLTTAITNAWLYRELERVHRHQSNVFGQMREGVVAVNNLGIVTLVNQAACDLAGTIELDSAVNELHSEVGELLGRTLELQAPIHDFETTIDVPDSGTLNVLMSSSCLHGIDGEIEGAVALIYDLSQIKSLEANVQRADRLSSIGTLAAGMAHEIKNPLVSIKTFTQLLLERYSDPDFRTTFHEVVPHEVERIDTIVTRLLDFARPRPVRFEPQNIRIIIDEVLALVDNQTRRADIEVQFTHPDEDIAVYGDEQQLHQVFLNLVMNSIDAIEEKKSGTLSINIAKGFITPNDGRPGSVFDTQPSVIVTLSDTGCGIAAKLLQELFTPFFTTKDDGCGLGLAVVHGIIGEHGGTIDVSSVLGESTTMRVSLPKAERIEVNSTVEDEVALRDATAKFLKD